MCYKDEVQRKNTEKLQRKFEQDNTPGFIQKYFINIESKAGAINYYIAIKDLLVWLMENKTINRNNIAEITPDDFYNVESEDVTMYLKQKEQSGMSPTTLETRKNVIFIAIKRHEMDNESRQILINLYMKCSNWKEVDTYVSNSK